MSHVIIFQNDNGGVSVCIPTGELPIDKVLEKDVPGGRGARIVPAADSAKPRQRFLQCLGNGRCDHHG
jgi:hypothetical protein